jgi:riboflavin kinase / FMN adenylyltransferase
MRILTIHDTLAPTDRSVITVGNFDGVHLGHQKLLQETASRARENGNVSVAVTFDPHTRLAALNQPNYPVLSTFEEKVELIASLSIDAIMRIPFDDAMSRKSPEEFVQEVLAQRLNCAGLVMGKGHAIGNSRAGDEIFLRSIEGKYHFSTFVTDLLAIEGKTISSTQIRDIITQGRITEAVLLLGHPYLVLVERTRGRNLGTKLGYPTLNFKSPPSQKVIPPPGVYAAEMEYRGRREQGALYFGDCPTLREPREVHFEFFSFHRGKDEIPVGDNATLWIHSFLRSDKRFGSTQELTEGIAIDVEIAKNFFNKEKEQWR